MDGTGPKGRGPLTGRKLGNCEGAAPRRGLGFFRFARGRKNQTNENFPRNRRFLNRNN